MRAELFPTGTEGVGLECGEAGEKEVTIRSEEKGALGIGILPTKQAFPCTKAAIGPAWVASTAPDFLSAASHTSSLFGLVVHPSVQVMVL